MFLIRHLKAKFPSAMILLALLSHAPFAHGQKCRYELDEKSVKLEWTGYKFTSKSPVSGSFDEVSSQAKSSDSVKGAFEAASFKINTASINSNNPVRDKKLALFIFGGLKNPGQISGEIISFNNSKAKVVIEMNGRKQEVPFKVSESNGTYTFEGSIKMTQFAMSESLARISEACRELHTGPDKKSKTWDDVGLKVSTTLKKSC